MPYPAVTLTEEAKQMILDGASAKTSFPLRDSPGPSDGSAADRILKARARMEMGNR